MYHGRVWILHQLNLENKHAPELKWHIYSRWHKKMDVVHDLMKISSLKQL